MLKITLIEIIFQIKNCNINISEETINNSNKYIIKKKINLLNILLTLFKVLFIIFCIYLLSNNIIKIRITNY